MFRISPIRTSRFRNAFCFIKSYSLSFSKGACVSFSSLAAGDFLDIPTQTTTMQVTARAINAEISANFTISLIRLFLLRFSISAAVLIRVQTVSSSLFEVSMFSSTNTGSLSRMLQRRRFASASSLSTEIETIRNWRFVVSPVALSAVSTSMYL